MDSIWTIKGAAAAALDATERSFDDIGGVQPVMTFRNMAADTLTWSVDLAALAPGAELLPELTQKVSLFRNGTRFFRGHVTALKQRGYRVDVTVSGPWWWLERMFLESTQTDATAATGTRATFALPKQSLKTSLSDLLAAAIALGWEVTEGTLATMFSAPELRLNQMSFAQAMAEVMRITPDLVAEFDYSGSGDPTFNTVRRLAGLAVGSATVVTLDGRDMESLDLNPLTEVEVSQVKVPFLKRHVSGAKQFDTQNSGTAALGKVQLITVSGDEMDTFLPKDLLDSVDVQTVLWTSITSAFIKERDGGLASIQASIGGVFGAVVPSFNYYSGTTGAGGVKTLQTVTVPGLSRRSETGAAFPSATKYLVISPDPLPTWAQEELGAIAVEITGTWVASWSDSLNGVGVGWPDVFMAMQAGATLYLGRWENSMTSGSTADYEIDYLARPFSVSGYLIDTAYASLTTVYKASDYDFISPPANFAAGLLAAQNYIPYVGELAWMEEDAGGTRYLSKAINVSHTMTAHASMKAMVSEEELDLETGVTRLVLGAPARFSYRELVNKMRGSSNDNIVYL